RTMGAGYLSATIFDKTAGIWLKPDHPVRKYGSFIAFFAPDMVRLALGSSRIAASPFLTRAGNFFTSAGNRLLAIAIMNYGVRRLIVDSDYDTWVNRRVADKVYDKEVYQLDSHDWFVLPLALKGLRAGARFLAPDAIDWSVAFDESKMRENVL